MIPILDPDPESSFPPVEQALEYPEGLLAVGGDLEPARLLNAYRHGIFPWYSDDEPILWWSPAPRCVIYPAMVHVSRRLRRRYNQGAYTLTVDTRFSDVIKACAAPRPNQQGTWITEGMKTAYSRLFHLGYAHAVEVWLGDSLVGGIYGLALGRVFFGESMFSRSPDASKIALVALCHQLRQWNFEILDCQVKNPHLISMGAIEISREKFQQHLQAAQETDHWRAGFTADPAW